MGGARDAGIVVADSLLALMGEAVVVEVEAGLDEAAQVVLDGGLVLRSGWHDLGRGDVAVGVELVAVEQGPAGSLGGTEADGVAAGGRGSNGIDAGRKGSYTSTSRSASSMA